MVRARLPVCLALLLVGGGACASKGRSKDAQEPAMGTSSPGDSVDARERDLDEYEAQLRALGLAPSRDEDGVSQAVGEEDQAPEAATSTTSADRCDRICGLAEAICELETNVCDLARAHPGDARYERVCTRAHDDCALASSACEACTDA